MFRKLAHITTLHGFRRSSFGSKCRAIDFWRCMWNFLFRFEIFGVFCLMISRLERFRSSAQGTKKAIPIKLRSRASLHWMEIRLYILIASPWHMFAAIPLPFEFLHALENDINLPPIFYCSRSVWVSDTRPGSESRTENVSLQNSRLVPRIYTVPSKFKTYIDSWTWRAGRVITGDTHDVRSKEILKNLYWTPIEQSLTNREMIMTFKALTAWQVTELSWRTISKCENNSYSLKSNNTKLKLPKPKTNFLKRNFSHRAAKSWNELSIVK